MVTLKKSKADTSPKSINLPHGFIGRPWPTKKKHHINTLPSPLSISIREWSLITGRWGRGLQNGKIAGPKLFAPPSRQGKIFCAPTFKEWKLFVPPFNMAKTSRYCVKTTPKLVVPPFSMAKTFSAPTPRHFLEVKLHMPPLPFCCPPSP